MTAGVVPGVIPPGFRPPAHWHVPSYVKTLGPEVADLCELAGYAPDPQQRWLLDMAFALDENNRTVAFEIAAIVGRQNLKTGFFKQCLIGWLVLTEERLVVWSAHEFSTSQEAFFDLDQLFSGSDYLRKRTRTIHRSHGSESIEMRNGCRCIFKTRTKGGGRGLTGNKIILDEAYALKATHMGALLPTLSTVESPQLLYGSMAGLKESETLREIRDRGRAGTSPKQGYAEWCAPGPEITCDAGADCSHAKIAIGCGCDKPRYWALANPTLGDRITVEYVEGERQAMPVDEFCRERMGWWDDPDEGTTKLVLIMWYARADRASTPASDSQLALGIHVAKDGSASAISLAGWREDNKMHVELAEYLPGTGWLVDRVVGIADRRKPCVVVLDPASPAGAFEKELRNRGFKIQRPDDKKPFPSDKHRLHILTSREYAQSCSMLVNGITNDEIVHPDQGPLNDAARDSRSREMGEMWVWDQKSGGADGTPLISATHAACGLQMYGKRVTPEPFFL